MIWREYKLIFIHIPRTGGSSFEESVCGSEEERLRREKDKETWVKHLDAYRAERLWPEEFHDPAFTVVTIIRNPGETVVSQYLQNRALPTRIGFNAWLRGAFRDTTGSSPFYLTSAEVDNYRADLLSGVPDPTSAGRSMTRFLSTRTPRKITLLRFERLQKDTKELLGRLGISGKKLEDLGHRLRDPRMGDLPRLPDGRVDYRAMYDTDTREALECALSEDFRLWRNGE